LITVGNNEQQSDKVVVAYQDPDKVSDCKWTIYLTGVSREHGVTPFVWRKETLIA
jgi:hypothetical protein